MMLAGSAVTFCILSTVTVAQDPIRVEARQVLVPTTAYKSRMIWRGGIEEVTINDLTAQDFHLFEDDVEQRIQNVTWERTPGGDVRDSMGIHFEFNGPGGGKWSSRERLDTANVRVIFTTAPHYLIAYSPPESPEGSCHQLGWRRPPNVSSAS